MELNVVLDILSLKKALNLYYRKRLIITIIANIFIILYGIGIIIVSQYNSDYPLYFGIIMFLLGLFSLISWIIKKRKIINLSIKQMQQRFDGDSCSFLFNLTDNDIINKNLKNGNIVSIKYKEFAKCIESKDVILVVTNLKQFVFIPKNNLNSSENEKIINIIKDKGIKYKRVKYIHN